MAKIFCTEHAFAALDRFWDAIFQIFLMPFMFCDHIPCIRVACRPGHCFLGLDRTEMQMKNIELNDCDSSLLILQQGIWKKTDQHSYTRFICKHCYAPHMVLLWTVICFPSKSIPWHFPPRTWGTRVLLGTQGRIRMQSVSSAANFEISSEVNETTWTNPIKYHQRILKICLKSALIARMHQDYGGETDHIFAELVGSKKR